MSYAVSLLVVGVLSVLAFFADHYFEDQFKETISRQQFTMISALAEQIDDKIFFAHEQLKSVANGIPPDFVNNPVKAQQYLESRFGSRRVFDGGIYLINLTGRMYAGAGIEPHMRGKDYSFREYFQKTITTKKPYISDPLLTTQKSGHPTVVFTVPIFDRHGAIVSILIGALDLMRDNFLGKLATVKVATSGYLYLYNTSRTIIVHPDRSRIMKQDVPPGANRLFDMAIAGFEGTGATVNSRGLHALSTFKRLKSTNWILAANYPEAEAYAPIYKAKHYFLMALAVVVIVTILIVWSFMRHLTTPLREFTSHVQKIADNEELRNPINISTRDEIGTLTQAFNRMMSGLNSKSTALMEEKKRIKNALSMLNATFDSTADGILVTDNQGAIVRLNRKFIEIWRFPESTEHKRTIDTVESFFKKLLDEAPDFQAKVRNLAMRPEMESHDFLEFNDGRTFEIFSQPQRIEDAVVGRVWSFRDITERKMFEARLRHAEKMEAIGTLAGGIAHDFNTILTAIIGYCNVLNEETDRNTPLAKDCLQEILSAADRGTLLTRSLLTYSRQEPMNLIPQDLNVIVKRIEGFLSKLLGKQIDLVLTLWETELKIMADCGQIEQVLMNLTTNARDAMSGKGRVEISTSLTEVDHQLKMILGNGAGRGMHALLTVSDSGAGMDDKTIERIFEPFFTTKETGRGTGLGLAIVYGIIQQHRGSIFVSSHPGQGTSFYLYFPLTEPHSLVDVGEKAGALAL